MTVRVWKHKALDAARSVGECLGEDGCRGIIEHDIAMLLPATIQLHESGRRIHLRTAIEECLSQAVGPFRLGLPTMLEVPLQLADGGGVKRCLELVVHHAHIVAVGPVQWPRKHNRIVHSRATRKNRVWA